MDGKNNLCCGCNPARFSLRILLLQLENDEAPDCDICCCNFAGDTECSKYVTKTMVSAPACQKKHTFPMYFNNSYLRPISSILDRCARSMIPMVWRTCRICAFKNDTYFKRISTISLYHDMCPLKILFSPMVLATFSRLHQFYIIFTNHDRDYFC